MVGEFRRSTTGGVTRERYVKQFIRLSFGLQKYEIQFGYDLENTACKQQSLHPYTAK